jgi:hypothetical protein
MTEGVPSNGQFPVQIGPPSADVRGSILSFAQAPTDSHPRAERTAK